MTLANDVPPNQKVHISHRSFGDIVREAESIDSTALPPRDPAYEFQNGRRFVSPRNPYEPAA